MAEPRPVLVVDWEKRPRGRPQASLEKYAPDLAIAAARRMRELARGRPRADARMGHQMALDDARPAVSKDVVELELKPSSRLKEIYVAPSGPARPAYRSDDQLRAALLKACEQGAARDEAVMIAARECAVPLTSIPLVEGLLDDLVLEGSVAAYGDVLFARRKVGRKVVAVDVGEDDLIDLLSKGHRVIELK